MDHRSRQTGCIGFRRISLGSLLSVEPRGPTHADHVVPQGSEKSKFSEKGATCRGGTIECMSAEGMGSVSSWIVTFRQLHVKFWIGIPIGFVPCLSRKSTNGYNTLRQKDSAARSEAPSARSIVPNPTCIRIRCSHGAM